MSILALTLLFIDLSNTKDAKEIINERPGEYSLVFTEELRFDGSLPSNDFNIFPGQVIYLDINELGDFFIGDYLNQRVLQYDEDGVFIKYVAVQGQGPGEILYLAGVQVLSDGGIVVLNREGATTTAIFLDSQAKFQKKVTLNRSGFGVNAAKISPNGKFIESEFRITDNQKLTIDLKTGIFDQDMNLIHTVTSTHHQRAGRMIPDNAFWVKFFSYISKLSLSNKGMMAFNHKNDLFIAERNKYKITRYNEELKPELVFGRNVKPSPYTEEDMDRFAQSVYDLYYVNMAENFRPFITLSNVKKGMSKAKLNAVKPMLVELIPMEDGMLMAITEDNQIERTQTADIFDKNGKYLCSSTMKDFAFIGEDGSTRMVFKNGKAYTVLSQEDGSNYAVRYGYQLVKN